MLHFYTREGLARALTLDLEPRLHRLLADRIGALREELIDYTEYLVIQPNDTEDGIIGRVGLSPLEEPFDGIRFGSSGFWPHWSWLGAHDGWYEMIFTFGGDYATVLMIQDADGVPTDLLRLCRAYIDDPDEP